MVLLLATAVVVVTVATVVVECYESADTERKILMCRSYNVLINNREQKGYL